MGPLTDQAATLRAAAALRQRAGGAENNGGNMRDPADNDGEPGGGGRPKASPFSFSQPPRHNKEQLRSLKLLHENFCQPLAKMLNILSGLPCRVMLQSLAPEKLALADTRVHLCAACSNGGRFLLAFSRPAAWLLLERLLGGSGGADSAQDRPHSDLEKSILSQLLATPVLDVYAETWASIARVQFAPERFVEELSCAPGLSAATETVAAVFSLRLGDTAGELAVLLPFQFLKPFIPGLDMVKILNAGQEAGGAPAGGKALLGIPVNLRVFFGRIDIKLRDLNGLAKGDVLRLDTRPDDEVTVEVEGLPRFGARTGKVGNGLGVQIVRILAQEKPKDGDKNANLR